MAEQPPAGYIVNFEREQNTAAPVCVTCFEQNGWQMWEHTPILYQAAEQEGIRCDWCHQLLVADYLQRQIDAAGRLLRDCYQFLEYGGIGGAGWPYSEDWKHINRLKEQTQPYYYQYVEHRL